MNFLFKKNSGLTLEHALSLEWLETNGLGGYASSTILQCHSRKYHGLLVAKIPSLPDKFVLLSKLEDILIQEKHEHYLTAHSYPNFLQDGGFQELTQFELTSHPITTFEFEKAFLTKEMLMPQAENTILVRYKISAVDAKTQLRIRPLIACRNFHQLTHENQHLQSSTEKCKSGIKITPYQTLPTLFFQTEVDFEFQPEPLWYRDFLYAEEEARGYPHHEDLFSPGVFTLKFNQNKEIIFSCSLLEQERLDNKWHRELTRRLNAGAFSVKKSSLQKRLQTTGQSFIELDEKLQPTTVVAGYHWFLEWGRDAMIALPGLTLYSGQEKTCLAVLKEFAKHEVDGLIPNFLGHTKEQNAYNSVDASLWFAWAMQQYYLKTKDYRSLALNLWPTLKNIYRCYKQGTLHQIKMQENGLLYAGSPDVNLTWMDAMIDGKPVTPRYGLAVEVNALWFNMLCFMHELSTLMLDNVRFELEPIIAEFPHAFSETFWNPHLHYLYDFVNAEQKNAALRPNQIFAVSLPYIPLANKMCVKVVAKVCDHLFTKYGLRTLASTDKNYCGTYSGDQATRDRAYHNGTIWPWMLAHFAEALLKVTNKHKAVEILMPCLDAFTRHLATDGIGSISEIFSGDEPHKANGCISQAWSVAEILRLTYLIS